MLPSCCRPPPASPAHPLPPACPPRAAEENEGGEGLRTEEWLAKVAALGRASAPLTLPQLADRLAFFVAALQKALQSGARRIPLFADTLRGTPAAAALQALRGAAMYGCWPRRQLTVQPPPAPCPLPAGEDPSVELEQLCWLVTMCGHVLADPGDGETPLVPMPIADACQAAAGAPGAPGTAAADPAQRLSAGLLAVGSHCLAHSGGIGASPRCEAVAAVERTCRQRNAFLSLGFLTCSLQLH